MREREKVREIARERETERDRRQMRKWLTQEMRKQRVIFAIIFFSPRTR